MISEKNPAKLRYLYEVAPLAFLVEVPQLLFYFLESRRKVFNWNRIVGVRLSDYELWIKKPDRCRQ
jgi:hypothetical protein